MNLRNSGLEFEVEQDRIIWSFIKDFVSRHNHVPSVGAVKDHYDLHHEEEVVRRLAHLVVMKPLYRGDFMSRLDDLAEQRRIRRVGELLNDAAEIVRTGRKVKQGREEKSYKGPSDAVKYILEQSPDIVAPTLGTKLSGEITRDGADFEAEYKLVSENPRAGMGQHTGLTQMDTALNGAKQHELWVHSAFTGHMKSTFMLNWAYNQAIWYQWPSLIFSLEMPYSQVRRILYAIHSYHRKFAEVRHKMGLQRDPGSAIGIPYQNIRDGNLEDWHPRALEFMKEYVIPDLNGKLVINGKDQETGEEWDHPKEYGKIHVEVADPDKSDFTVADMRQRAELIYSQSPFATVFVDHAGLMAPRKWVSSTTDRLNEVIRDCKRMAMSFNRGQGMAMVVLFQINRDGYKQALKRKEKGGTASYDLTALSYANECCVKGTLVPTYQSGLVPIETVTPGDSVWSTTGWKRVLEVFDQGSRPAMQVLNDRGMLWGGTGDHRLRVVGDGGLEWKTVSELVPGDYLVGALGGNPDHPLKELPPLEIEKYEKPNGEQGVPLVVPKTPDPALGYLLGAWDGDGCVHPKGIGFTGNRQEHAVRDRIQESFRVCFGHPIGCFENPSRSGSFDMLKWSQPLKRWFEAVAGERGVEVPSCVLAGGWTLWCDYLQGLFDTDGWINKAGVIGLKLKWGSEGLLRTVQQMLLGLGIDSYFKRGKTPTHGCYLRIRSRQGRALFLKHIGFTHPPKSFRLYDLVRAGEQSDRRGDTQMYPVPETYCALYDQVRPRGTPEAGFRRGFRASRLKARRTGLVSRGDIETLLGHLKDKGLWDDRASYLQLLVRSLVSQVVSVTDIGSQPVYDLEVGGDHEYQTGPFLSHNCERSADVVTASWMDNDLQNSNRVQFQCLKSRDQKPFEIFNARVEWPCRRIVTCNEVSMNKTDTENAAAVIDGIKALDSNL